MKKLLLLLLLIAPAAFAQQATVTGNIRNVVANPVTSKAFVRFRLQNFVGQVPRVIGTGVVVQTEFDVTPDASGNISTTLYRNDFINPSGTFYRVEYWYQGVIQHSTSFLITKLTFDLDTETPLSAAPILGPAQLITQIYACTVGTPATTWTCTHNFNDPNVQVEVFSTAGQLMWADTITQTSANVATLTFINPTAGVALISHSGSIAIATNQPNAIVSNPTGVQTITGSFPLNISAPTSFATGNLCIQNGSFSSCFLTAATANRTLSLPDASGSLPLTGANQTWNGTQTFSTAAVFSAPPSFTQTTGTAPFSVTSTTAVANLNAALLNGNTFESPGAIGSTTPNSAVFSTSAANSYTSRTTNSASTGILRLANAECIDWRNAANSGDLALCGNSSNQLTFSGSIVPGITGAVTAGHMAVFADSSHVQDGGAPQTGVILALTNTTQSGTVGMSANTVTNIITKTVTMPASGCPCRADVHFSHYISTTQFSDINSYVSDGTSNFAAIQNHVTGSGNYGMNYAEMSPTTYSNNASVTFTLKSICSSTGCTAQVSPAQGAGQGSTLQIVILPD